MLAEVNEVITNRDLVNTITKMMGNLDTNPNPDPEEMKWNNERSKIACDTVTAWCNTNKRNRSFCVEASDEVWDDLLQKVFEGQPPVLVPENKYWNFRKLCARLGDFQSGKRTFDNGDNPEFRSLGAFVRTALCLIFDSDDTVFYDAMVRAIAKLYTGPTPHNVPFDILLKELNELQDGDEDLSDDRFAGVRGHKAYMLAALSYGRYDLKLTDYDAFKDDYDVILAAVKWNGDLLQYASEALRDNYDVVLAAVTWFWDELNSRYNGGGFEHASERLRGDPRIVKTAIETNDAKSYSPYGDSFSSEVELEDIWKNVPKGAKVFNDSTLIKNTLRWRGELLRFMPESIRGNPLMVKIAVDQSNGNLKYASDKLLNDSEFLLSFFDEGYGGEFWHTFMHTIPDGMKKNKEFIIALCKRGGEYVLENASEELKDDREVVMAAVENEGADLEYANKRFRKDFDVVLAAVEQNGLALLYADEKFQKDDRVVLAAVRQDGMALQYVTKINEFEDLMAVMAAVEQNGLALQYADEELKKDQWVVLAAVKQNGLALQYADEEIKKNKNVILAAVEHVLHQYAAST